MANDDKNKQQQGGQQQAKPGFVKVANLHRAPIGLPPVHHETREGVPLRIKHPEQILAPGDNQVSAEHWQALKDHSVVKNWLEAGMIREGEIEKPREPTGETARESLVGLSDEDSMKYVEASTNREQLLKWQQTERRGQVRDTINRRVEALGQGQK